MESSNDESLWMERIAQGDEFSMQLLIEKWQNPLFRFFYRSLSNHADSEDLTQKTFIRVYGASTRYRPDSKFTTWLFTIARNLLIDEIKRKKRFQAVQLSDNDGENELHSTSRRISDWHEILETALKKMPENHRTALLFRVQRELSYSEIARIMGANEQLVKTWIHRARKQLKGEVKKLDLEGEI